MRRTFIAVLAIAAASLAACATTVVDAPAGTYAVGADFHVNLSREWSDVSGIMYQRPKNVRLLSVDGPLLNRLYLSDGLAPGEFLVKPTAKEKPTPTYRADLSPTEIVEFVSDSVDALDYQKVATSNLRPAALNGVDALRFDISARTKEGLEVSGTALTAEKNGKLYVILYLAPTEHYFTANLAEVEAVMKSAAIG